MSLFHFSAEEYSNLYFTEHSLNGHAMVLTLRDKKLPSPSLAEHEANRWRCCAAYGCCVGPLWPSCRLFRQQRADRGTSDRKGFEGDKWRNSKTRGQTVHEHCELSDWRKTCMTEWPSSKIIYVLIYARDSYMHTHPYRVTLHMLWHLACDPRIWSWGFSEKGTLCSTKHITQQLHPVEDSNCHNMMTE